MNFPLLYRRTSCMARLIFDYYRSKRFFKEDKVINIDLMSFMFSITFVTAAGGCGMCVAATAHLYIWPVFTLIIAHNKSKPAVKEEGAGGGSVEESRSIWKLCTRSTTLKFWWIRRFAGRQKLKIKKHHIEKKALHTNLKDKTKVESGDRGKL